MRDEFDWRGHAHALQRSGLGDGQHEPGHGRGHNLRV